MADYLKHIVGNLNDALTTLPTPYLMSMRLWERIQWSLAKITYNLLSVCTKGGFRVVCSFAEIDYELFERLSPVLINVLLTVAKRGQLFRPSAGEAKKGREP